MHRLFLTGKITSHEKITFSDKKQLHHMRDVLRLKKGESVVVVDAEGCQYSCVIQDLLPASAILEVIEKRSFASSHKLGLTIACALPKGPKMDDIINKLTQLGVERVIPMITERVIVKPQEKQGSLRQQRWQKIALSAAQQSQRKALPVIEPIKMLEDVLMHSKGYDLRLIPTLSGNRSLLGDVLDNSVAKNVIAIIGPEGDFTADEVELSQRAGFVPVSLGNLILRVDTAAIAVCSYIMLHSERLSS